MLRGPIWSKIPRFALPVAATAILEQLFNASDIAVVGNFTGDASTAAVRRRPSRERRFRSPARMAEATAKSSSAGSSTSL